MISKDDIDIAYDVHGSGDPALVFVHGWSCDRSYWAGQLPVFSRRFRVVALDLGGHGESGLGRRAWTIESFGDDVAAVVQGLGLGRVVLIGHSMGGDVVVAAARGLPGRVAALVWVDTYAQFRTLRTAEQVQEFVAPFRTSFVESTRAFVRGMFPAGADPALVERVAADMSSAPPEVALECMESSMNHQREVPRALAELSLPLVAINPDYRPTDLESMRRHGIEVVMMSGVGHFPMMEAPERFNAVLESVIEGFER